MPLSAKGDEPARAILDRQTVLPDQPAPVSLHVKVPGEIPKKRDFACQPAGTRTRLQAWPGVGNREATRLRPPLSVGPVAISNETDAMRPLQCNSKCLSSESPDQEPDILHWSIGDAFGPVALEKDEGRRQKDEYNFSSFNFHPFQRLPTILPPTRV